MAQDCYRIVHDGHTFFNQFNFTVHYLSDQTNAPKPWKAASDLLDAYNDVMTAKIQAILSEQVYLTALTARRVNNSGGATASLPLSNIQGERLGSPSVPSAGPLLLMPAKFGARRVTGRIFLPGVSAEDLVDGRMTPDYSAELQELADDLNDTVFNTVESGAFHLCVHSRSLDQSVFPEAVIAGPALGTLRNRAKPLL